MTVKQFDNALDSLLTVVRADEEVNLGDVLDILLKYTEEIRGEIIRRSIVHRVELSPSKRNGRWTGVHRPHAHAVTLRTHIGQ